MEESGRKTGLESRMDVEQESKWIPYVGGKGECCLMRADAQLFMLCDSLVIGGVYKSFTW